MKRVVKCVSFLQIANMFLRILFLSSLIAVSGFNMWPTRTVPLSPCCTQQRQYARLAVDVVEFERLRNLGFETESDPTVLVATFVLPEQWSHQACKPGDDKDIRDVVGVKSCIYDDETRLRIGVIFPETVGELLFYVKDEYNVIE